MALTEDQVVDAVCRKLTSDGYSIVQRALVTQHGFDIAARKDGVDLIIEAKGAGSSKAGTARYGKEFSPNQVFDHVAKAVLKALRVVSSGGAQAGIALPDNANHRREVEQVALALRQAGVAVFWVDDGGGVRVDAHESCDSCVARLRFRSKSGQRSRRLLGGDGIHKETTE